ncbi:MAG: SDR family oxidoreductase [Spirochaetales bacterium]|nr:SDR family oxidoreductase [Spirochaetales bacterium]
MPWRTEPLALVTGVARLGTGWVRLLRQNGWQVAYSWHQLPPPELETLTQTQPELVHGFRCDLEQPYSAGKLFDQVTHWAGKTPSLVLHAASRWFNDTVADTTEEAWFTSLRLHAWPLAAWTRQLLAAGTPASLITVLDARTSAPTPGEFSYGWGKRLAAGLVADLARQAAPLVRVNGLALGPVLSPTGGELRWDSWVKALPLGVQPPLSDIDQALLFLLNSTSVTGEILHIDGGAGLVRRELSL